MQLGLKTRSHRLKPAFHDADSNSPDTSIHHYVYDARDLLARILARKSLGWCRRRGMPELHVHDSLISSRSISVMWTALKTLLTRLKLSWCWDSAAASRWTPRVAELHIFHIHVLMIRILRSRSALVSKIPTNPVMWRFPVLLHYVITVHTDGRTDGRTSMLVAKRDVHLFALKVVARAV